MPDEDSLRYVSVRPRQRIPDSIGAAGNLSILVGRMIGDHDGRPGAIVKPVGHPPVGEKTGGKLAYRLADTTQPFTSGEEPTISPETRKPRQPGDVPTQTTQEAMIAPPSGGGISFGQAKGEALRGRKKGDVPTRDRDINIVDKHDQRDNATTVHGLGQHSTDIAASNIAAEHT